ncbi:MAG TPA: AMP-binding protein, partial [Woeseiaceae bacterium]
MDTPAEIDDRLEFSTIGDLVGHWKQRGSDAAVIAVGSTGTMAVQSYASLSREVVRLAHGLMGAGLRDKALILLWAPNSPEWIVAYFGIVAAGKIVIPLDDQMSSEQLPGVVRNSTPDCVFTTAGHVEAIRRAGLSEDVRCFLLDVDETVPGSWTRAAVADGPVSVPATDAGQVAVLLYTSGTTGTPKGVPLTHANLMSNVRALVAADIIDRTDRVLLPLPLHHAYPATVGMLSVLACGGTIVLPSGVSGPELTTAANRAGATILIGVPRLYQVLADSIETGVGSSGVVARILYPLLLATATFLHRILGIRIGGILFRRIHKRIGGRLRLLVSGGARLEPQLASKLEGLGWLVLTGYGLTETSPVVSFNTPSHRRLDSQGRPVSGVEIRLDKGIDEPYGEILITGANVFSGYWMDDTATREAFTEAGWFRTNDLGFVDPEGYLHVMGRKTEVIVLSDGKKISPEGLERLYEASPFIREAALLAHDGTLAAILVPDEEALRGRGAISAKSLLRDELERELQSLPSYQRVAEFRLARQSLPRTRLGKLKRHLLPEIFAKASAASM